MSLRLRLIIICLLVALLPAIPLSLLVSNLLETSFNIGFNETVSGALDGGMTVSRAYLDRLQVVFENEAARIAARFPDSIPDSSLVISTLSEGTDPGSIDGFVILGGTDPVKRSGEDASGRIDAPPEVDSVLERITGGVPATRRASSGRHMEGLSFFVTDDRSIRLAVWQPPAACNGGSLVLFGKIDPEFIGAARRVLAGQQTFAKLRLVEDSLSRSFFYPFIIIYGIILVISLGLALFLAERLAAPLRRLASATTSVADGNWSIQLEPKAGGEIGRLISGFNRMVLRLESQRRRLTDLEKMAAWREMARHLAHEIKNPLLPIRLAVQEMRDQYKGENGQYREFLGESMRVVEDELSHLRKLVREFSAFARMPGMVPVQGSLPRLATDVAKLYAGARITIEAVPGVPDFPFDPDHMRRVLVNLIENSLSAVPDGVAAAVTIKIGRSGENVIVEFSDNGPGIPGEHRAMIFEPYFTTRTGGTGLGLALVKNIILLHGGTIEVGGGPGQGATFTITLPLAGPRVESHTEEG